MTRSLPRRVLAPGAGLATALAAAAPVAPGLRPRHADPPGPVPAGRRRRPHPRHQGHLGPLLLGRSPVGPGQRPRHRGLRPGRRRAGRRPRWRQGTSTTPAGTFPLLHAFGAGNPGTRMGYRRVTGCSWWVQDPRALDYNRWRESCRVPRSTARSSEHLADYVRSGLYRQTVVIGYNYARPRPRRHGDGSGAGIFLHYARSYTGGCVAVDSTSELTATVRWLDPRKKPYIVVKA